MNGMQAVTDLAVFLAKHTSYKVFKYEKSPSYSGEYLVVNSLPFAYGSSLNGNGTLNVNVHVPDLGSGLANTKRVGEIVKEVCLLIPNEAVTEEGKALEINGAYYAIESDSNLMADEDNTHFINLKINVLFNELNQ